MGKKRRVKKVKRDGSKSAAVRDFIKANPKAAPKEIHETLSKKGVDVSLALISKIKYTDKKTPARKKKRRGPGRPRKTTAAARNGRRPGRPKKAQGLIQLDDLQAAKEFSDAVGGLDEARAAIDALHSLRQ